MTVIPRYFRLLALILASLALIPAPESRAQFEPPGPEWQFSDAYQLFSDQLYREAIRGFADFQRQHPDHVQAADALYFQAEASLSLGLEEEAVRLFTRFEHLYPTHPLASQARLALGKYFFESSDFDRASEVFAQILNDNPSDDLAAKALYWMGEAALSQGRFDRAIEHFRSAADRYRGTTTAPTALYAIGYTQVRQGRYDEAAEAFEHLAARYPESPYARNIGLALAEVYYELNDYQRAVTEIQRRMPNLGTEARERATFLLAESYNQLRDSENAIVQYRRFTESSPGSPYFRRALYGLAWNYHFSGTYQWAVEHFERVRTGHADVLAEQATYYQAVNEKLAERPFEAIDLFREYLDRWPRGELASHAQFELGITYYEQRMWQEAHDAFDRVIGTYRDPELLGEALHLRGNTAIALGDFDEALSSFDRAVELDAIPASLRDEMLFQKAWLQYRNNQFAESARAFMALHEEAPRSEQGGEALFWAAESFFQLDRHGRAAELFQRYLREFRGGKQTEAATYALGWTYFKQSRYNEAIDAFRRFLEAYRQTDDYVPYRTDAQLRLADSYYALKRYPEAIRLYGQVAEAAGDYALYQIAQSYYNSGDGFEAMTAFRRLLTEYPDSDWAEQAQYAIGYIYFHNQDYDQAIAEYRRIIEQKPRSAIAAKVQYGIGDALFNAGRPEESMRAYMTVLERYPNSPYVGDAATGIQYALAAMGDGGRANRIIDEFVAQNPNSPLVDELRFRQAEVKYQSGRENEALADFQRFVRTSGNNQLLPEAYYYMGTIYADRGSTQEAVSYLRQIVDGFSGSTRYQDAARRLGQLHLEAGRHQEALEVFRGLERTRSGNDRSTAEARYGQGIALLNLGRTQEAERLLREAVQDAPDAPETMPAYLGLARVYEETGRMREAVDVYRRLVDRSRDEVGAEALFRWGDLLLRRGEARAAVEQLGRMPVLFAGFSEWIARGYLAQARAFQQLGQKGDATRLYDRVIDEFSGTTYAQTASRERDAL